MNLKILDKTLFFSSTYALFFDGVHSFFIDFSDTGYDGKIAVKILLRLSNVDKL